MNADCLFTFASNNLRFGLIYDSKTESNENFNFDFRVAVNADLVFQLMLRFLIDKSEFSCTLLDVIKVKDIWVFITILALGFAAGKIEVYCSWTLIKKLKVEHVFKLQLIFFQFQQFVVWSFANFISILNWQFKFPQTEFLTVKTNVATTKLTIATRIIYVGWLQHEKFKIMIFLLLIWRSFCRREINFQRNHKRQKNFLLLHHAWLNRLLCDFNLLVCFWWKECRARCNAKKT